MICGGAEGSITPLTLSGFANMKALSKTGYFDENIFLYYEEHDLYFRCNKLNLPIYLIDDAKVFHELER